MVGRVVRVPTELNFPEGRSDLLIADEDKSPSILHQILDELKDLGTYQRNHYHDALQALQYMEERVEFLELQSRVASAEGLAEDIALVLICCLSVTALLFIISAITYTPGSG
ncbi:hypothetical protein PM082_012392 [Marasmius tenuissimus]|nr:hypothetical protein PM082_012392 [Marasmius tenuissimus]